MRPRAALGAALLAILALPGCDRILGPPPRPKTDGYEAVVTVRNGARSDTFALAVRGDAIRRSLGLDEASPYLLRTSATGPVVEVDPGTKTTKPADAARLLAGLEEVPLAPGFTHYLEAGKRGLKSYHRESDGIFAGMACQVWRFDDRPDDPTSPSTTYWVASALDDLVVRWVRVAPGPPGTGQEISVELTRIRVGPSPSLFTAPTR